VEDMGVDLFDLDEVGGAMEKRDEPLLKKPSSLKLRERNENLR
jgi:hypothetical protein